MTDAFMHGSRLKKIDLSENRFHGQISKSLANCTDLEVLSLGDNSFNDVFPNWLEDLPELQVLILRSNKFHGAIEVPPNARSTFPMLRIIDLSNNHFTGRLPDTYFQNWTAMKSGYAGKSSFMQLEISLEAFVERFPYSMTIINKGFKTDYHRIVRPSIDNLNKLESLDLSGNKLSGKIPQELLKLGFLAILNVSFNQLDGRIPQGKQFNTFENNSYIGNLGLCGKPLSKGCQNSKASTPPQTSHKSSESFLPSERADWIVIFCGVGSGLVVGIVFGNFLYDCFSDWFIERFGMRKNKWIRPLKIDPDKWYQSHKLRI
ncbi:hypothetical protein OSB04_006030 [Centaurea solstitialis]|uniref:Uncharacterized protein n=1 Tax=Centaurea solstitialis TaxID=347529 RepID=A0AA38WQ37_9ASTR|nr:hypothetical protein OSB04_006030 [Centaurea solstitialis]